MFGFIKTLFSSPKIANDILDKDNGLVVRAGEWIGNLSYTEEEQAENRSEIAKEVIKFVETTLHENTERSKTRRAIAVAWIRVQLFLILITALVIPIDKDLAKEYFALATSEVMLWGTGSVIVFFFGAYVWGTHISKKNK